MSPQKVIFIFVLFFISNAFAQTQELILLENNQNKLIYIQDGEITHTVPLPQNGIYRAITTDNNYVYILQEMPDALTCTVLVYHNDTFNTLAVVQGNHSGWLDIEYIGNGRLLLLNSWQPDGRQNESSELYVLNFSEQSLESSNYTRLGTLIESSEGSDASEVKKIVYMENSVYSGVWCLEWDGDPEPLDNPTYNKGYGEDIFFFAIHNWEGTEGNATISGSNKTDIGAYGEYGNRSEVVDVALDQNNNLLILEQDIAMRETSYVGYNYSDDLYRIQVQYAQTGISFPTRMNSTNENIIGEWPYSGNPLRPSHIHLMAVDPDSGAIFGLDKSSPESFDTIISFDARIQTEMTSYTSTVDMVFVSAQDSTEITEIPGGTLAQDTLWSGKLRVTGDIVIPDGIRLDILPGTQVMFASLTDDQNAGNYTDRAELIAQNGSQLIIQGTSERPILMTSDNTPCSGGEWGGIQIHFEMASQSIAISHCTIQGAINGIAIEQSGGYATVQLSELNCYQNANNGLHVHVHSGAHLSLNVFSNSDQVNLRNNGDYGIYAYVEHDQSVLDINAQKLWMENNGLNGFLCHGYNKARINYNLTNNTSVGHNSATGWDKGCGFSIYDASNGVINGRFDNNTASFNHYGIYRYTNNCYSDQTSNTFYANTAQSNISTGLKYYQYRGTGVSLNFENNQVSSTASGDGINVHRKYRQTELPLVVELINNNAALNAGKGISVNWYNAIDIQVDARNNRCENNGGDGFFAQANHLSTFFNNQSLNNQGSGFQIYGNALTIQNNTSQNNGTNGFWIQNSSFLTFVSNIVSNNQAHGTFLDSVSKGYLLYNRIHENIGDGLNIKTTGEICVYNNNIYDNFIQEDEYQQYELRMQSGLMVDARYNFWGTDMAPDSVIWDRMDNTSLGFVDKSHHNDHLIPVPEGPQAFIIDPIENETLRTGNVYSISGIAVSEMPYTIRVKANDQEWQEMPGTIGWSCSFTPTEAGSFSILAEIAGIASSSSTRNIIISDLMPTHQGTIINNEIWTDNQSPIHVTGDITVAPNARLQIMPGTTVLFELSDHATSGQYPSLPELIVHGELEINGTVDNPVLLTSVHGAANGDMWGGISVVQTGIKQPLIIRHAAIASAAHGISYQLSDFSDPNHLTPVILDHVTVNNNQQFGLRFIINGCAGALSMNNLTACYNGGDGIFVQTINQSHFLLDLNQIESTFNSGSGLNLDNHGGSHVQLNISPTQTQASQRINQFSYNLEYGMVMRMSDNGSQLTATACAGLYSANAFSGLIIDTDYDTDCYYHIENNWFEGHTKAGGWYYGKGIGFENSSYALISGYVVNNIIKSNGVGIYRYNNSYNTDDRPDNHICNNQIIQNNSTGIYYYKRYGRGSKLNISENQIENNGGHGIQVYRQYRNNDNPMYINIAGNQCLSNTLKGIYVHRYNSSDIIQLTLSDNICQNNGDTGIHVEPTLVSDIFSNTSMQNGGNGIYAASQNILWIFNNTLKNNTLNGLYASQNPRMNCYLNEIIENQADGIHLESAGESQLLYNTISGNIGDGIEIHASDQINIHENNLTGNYAVDTAFEIRNLTNYPVDARFNYLGDAGNDPMLIWDRSDDINVGQVSIAPMNESIISMPDHPVAKITNPLQNDVLNAGEQTIVGMAISEIRPFTVEVSTDGGMHWYTAIGNTHWTYSWENPASGNHILMARINDNTPDQISVLIDPNKPTTSGTLVNSETWYGDFRDIVITGDITVPSGITLTIAAGTRILFAQNDDQRAGEITTKPELIIDGGAIIFQGTQDKPITLTTASETPAKGMWGGIYISHDENESGAVIFKHTTVSYSTWGIRYAGQNRQEDLILDHVNVFESNQNGLHVQLTGGSGALCLTDIYACQNAQHGLYLNFSSDANWLAKLSLIQASDNGKSGFLIETVDQANLMLTQTSAPNISSEFNSNQEYGVAYLVKNYAHLTLHAEAGLYSGNAFTGLYISGEHDSHIDFVIKGNALNHHENTRYWYTGSGICCNINNEYFAGQMIQNTADNNRYGIYYRAHYPELFQISHTQNIMQNNMQGGIFFNQYRGDGGNLTFIDNNIQYTTEGNGIYVYRRYSYSNTPLNVLAANNQLSNNFNNGLAIYHDNTSSGITLSEIHDNQCMNNNDRGIFLKDITSAKIYVNTISQNQKVGLELTASKASDILFNDISNNKKDAIVINCDEISRIHYNNLLLTESFFAINNQGDINIDARYNYFDSTLQPEEIIYDRLDNADKGLVTYDNALETSCNLDFSNERIQITDPPETETLVIPISPFTIRGIAVCRTGIKRVEVQMQRGGEWFPSDGTNQWTVQWDANRVGDYQIKARIIDNDNRIRFNSNQVSIRVSKDVPTTSGILASNEIWAPETGTLFISGDVTIPENTSLTITQGTLLTFASTDDRQSGADSSACELIVFGNLFIEGTSSNPVVLTPDSQLSLPGQFYGIRVIGDNDQRIKINQMHMQYAKNCISIEKNGGTIAAQFDHLTLTNSSGIGIDWHLTNTNGTIHIHDTVIQNQGSTGINGWISGGSGTIDFNNVISNENGHHGIAMVTTQSANWHGFLTDISASNNTLNDADGLYLETDEYAISNYTMTCPPDASGLSPCSFENNARNGLFAYAKNNKSELSISISGYTASNNGKNGFYLYGESSCKYDYAIHNTRSIFHKSTRGWEYGNGFLARGYLTGTVDTCNFSDNNLGFRNYQIYYPALIKNSRFDNNVTHGIYIYQYSGAANRFTFRENGIANNQSSGIYTYVKYTSYPFILELIKNTIQYNQHGVYLQRYQPSNHLQLMAFLNTITDNEKDALNLDVSDQSILYYNHISQKADDNHSIILHSDVSADARWNFWGTATQALSAGSHPRNLTLFHDIYDDASMGSVQYIPWLESSHVIETSDLPFSRILAPICSQSVHGGMMSILGFALSSDNVSHVNVSTDSGTTWAQAQWQNEDHLLFWEFEWEEYVPEAYEIVTQAVTDDGIIEETSQTCQIIIDTNAMTTSGELPGDETWSGDIILTGDIIVPENKTLTIQPGTDVSIPAYQDSTGENDNSVTEILVRGKLIAVGTSNERIFLGPSTEAQAGAWGGIRVEGQLECQYVDMYQADIALDIVAPEGNNQIVLDHNTFQDYMIAGTRINFDNKASGAIICTDNIWNSTTGTGLDIYYRERVNQANPFEIQLMNNRFENNPERGAYIHADGYYGSLLKLLVQNNYFYRNNTNGLYVYSTNRLAWDVRIENNAIMETYGQNAIALACSLNNAYDYENTLIIDSNTLKQNQSGIYVNAYNSSLKPVISNNTVSQSSDTGIKGEYSGNYPFIPEISGNASKENTQYNIDIEASDAVQVINNELSGDSAGLIALINQSSHNITATNNWWGVITSEEIAQRIYDHTDDTSKGQVVFDPWWDKYAPPESPSVTCTTQNTSADQVEIFGSKPENTHIRINGQNIETSFESTTWQFMFDLLPGKNVINAQTVNALNLVSDPVHIIIIKDIYPPELLHADPSDDAARKRVDKIVITLLDRDGIVDDQAVINSLSVNNAEHLISGHIEESSDQFVFTPDISPMPDDVYTITFQTMDTAGNGKAYTLSFVVDSQPPVIPMITGNELFSGTIQVRPFLNLSRSKNIVLTGTRQSKTSILINGMEDSDLSDDDWQITVALFEGINHINVQAKDRAGNISGSQWIDVMVDTVPPQISRIIPADGSFINVRPEQIIVEFIETTSGLSLSNCVTHVSTSENITVVGQWQIEENQLRFTPSTPLAETTYNIHLKLVDAIDHSSPDLTTQFTLDMTPPVAPRLNPLNSPTNNPVQTLKGNKETHAAILLNNETIVDHNPDIGWTYTIQLEMGTNHILLNAVDRAGNVSAPTISQIIFDDTAPPAVEQLTVHCMGDGVSVVLDWTAYDETELGDLAYYRIYKQPQLFTQISELSAFATVNAGIQIYTVSHLNQSQTYYFAIVAVDTKGNAMISVTPVPGKPIDQQPPPEVSNVHVDCHTDSAEIFWTPPFDALGDLDGFVVSERNQTRHLPKIQTSLILYDLLPSERYAVTISTIDKNQNISIGICQPVMTELNNPEKLTAIAGSGQIDLRWTPTTPEILVKEYYVYAHHQNFSTTHGLMPTMTTDAPHAILTGVINHQTYYIAVTTINTSGCENTSVHTVSTMPVFDVQLVNIKGNYISPVSAVNNYRLTIRFNTPMDTQIQPDIQLKSSGTIPLPTIDGGTWLGTVENNDTFVTNDIAFSEGMDGSISVTISNAQDLYGNVMTSVTSAYQFTLDATPPNIPEITIENKDCSSIQVSWKDYIQPDDLAGYRVYLSSQTFTTTVNQNSVAWLQPHYRSYIFKNLELSTPYYIAIVPEDRAGNKIQLISGTEIRIDRSILPELSFDMETGNELTSVILNWQHLSNVCGLTGYDIYLSETPFGNLYDQTPYLELDAASHQAVIDHLDRTKKYDIIVVPVNDVGDQVQRFQVLEWQDPLSGDLQKDIDLSLSTQKKIPIYHDIILENGASLTLPKGVTLCFADNSGLTVAEGTIIANGTALYPVKMTASNPKKGAWKGIAILSEDSQLHHVIIENSAGLKIMNTTANITALSSRNNTIGLCVSGNAQLTLSDALFTGNDIHIQAEDNANLTVSQSVLKAARIRYIDNRSNNKLQLIENDWGIDNIPEVIQGDCDYIPILEEEPLLTPAIENLGGSTTGSQMIDLHLACRNANEMRISEDSQFRSKFFVPFARYTPFTLSEGGGNKTIFVQFKSISGSMSPAISTTVTYITEGPMIQHFSLSEGKTIKRPVLITGQASAALGLNRISFHLNGADLFTSKTSPLSYEWDCRTLENGSHRVALIAWDQAGNFSKAEINVMLDIYPPPAPIIELPVDGVVTESDITISGTAEPDTTLRILRNGFVIHEQTMDQTGTFLLEPVTLIEGMNNILAVCEDMVGQSANSNIVHISLDTGPPASPKLLQPWLAANKGIVIQWQFADDGERPVRFNLYRSTSHFTDKTNADQVQTNIGELSAADLNLPDGTYYYAVTGLDQAGNESPLSNIVDFTHDQTPPQLTINFQQPQPFGVGDFTINLEVNEKLGSTPQLVYIPANTSDFQNIECTKSDFYTYTGIIHIQFDTPSGKARVFASARDTKGNAFSGELTDTFFMIDTAGPVASIAIDRTPPVQVLEPTTIQVLLELNELPEKTPSLSYRPPEGENISITLNGSGTQWQGELSVDQTMGTGDGSFIFQAVDTVGNTGNIIDTGKILEIYTSDVPLKSQPPQYLRATAKSEGQIQLTWQAPELAETYKIYRDSGTCDTLPTTLITEKIPETEYLDMPPSDGDWCYAVSSDRRGAESDLSTPFTVKSDSTPPGKPTDISVLLGDTGVIVSWNAPDGEAPYRYHVYRDENIVQQSYLDLHITDRPETGGMYQYRVASVDLIGNEHFSDPVSFNMTVGAVKSLNAAICQGQTPQLTWENADTQVVGFNVYRGQQQLNTDMITSNAYTDIYYTKSSVIRYQVRALKADGQESPSRIVDIFPLNIQVVANADEINTFNDLVLNGLNTMDITFTNEDQVQALDLMHLKWQLISEGQILFENQKQVDINLLPEKASNMQIIVPATDVYAPHILNIYATQSSDTGSMVIYEESFTFENVRRPDLWIDLRATDIPIAGGYATVQACIFNQGYADMDIIVTKDDGKSPGDISLTLKNQDGLVLNQTQYNGIPGKAFVISGSKSAFIRIAPSTSRCFTMNILVPENITPEADLFFEMAVKKYYHNAGSSDAIEMGTITGELRSGISQSEYFGSASVSNNSFVNQQSIMIYGQAINRITQMPEGGAELKIGLYARGFEWYETVTCDEFGSYTFLYLPSKGMSGHFVVWASHPDVYDRLNQDEFDVYRMYHTPATGDIRMSKADTLNFSISLYNPGITAITGFTYDFNAYIVNDQTGEREEINTLQGTVITDDTLKVAPAQHKSINMNLHADKDAPDNATVEYCIAASNGASVTFTGYVSLLPSVPLISVETPAVGYVEMSIDRGYMKSVPVRIQNKGLEDLLDVEIIPPEKFNWMQTNAPLSNNGGWVLGDIPVGAAKQFEVIFSPPQDLDFGDYEDKLVLKGINSELTFDIHLYATITSDQTGDVQFHVINIIGQDVEKARVRMRNVEINKELSPLKTDAEGMVTFKDIQEGEWSWQVIASGHATLAGVVTVIPNQTVLEEPMLSKSLVTINFKVEPVPFTDRYEIKLEQTFETHVPAAVLVINPTKVEFHDVQPGFETRFLVEARNEGLIMLHDTEVSTAETPWGRMEPMVRFIPELGAKESIMIPYRLVYDGPPEDDNRKRSLSSIADCLTGGFGGMAQGLKDLHSIHSALKGRSQCYKGHGMVAAAFLLGFIHGYNAMGMVNPVDFAANATMCAMQAMGIGFGYGESTGRITGSVSGSSSKEKYASATASFSSQKPCFTADTPVLMANLTVKSIQDIQIGDALYLHNGGSDFVRAVHHRKSDHMREIWYENTDGTKRRLETTDHHLFWCDNDWKAARKLVVGDLLVDRDENQWTVIRNERYNLDIDVYNIDLEAYRSYFANGVLVHERCGVNSF
jgi:parallel beta-helix repeat protein